MDKHCSYDGTELVVLSPVSTIEQEKRRCPECGRVYQEMPAHSAGDSVNWTVIYTPSDSEDAASG